jgi:peptide chain release factor 2
LAGKEEELQKLDALIAKEDFWNDPDSAQKTLQRRSALAAPVEEWNGLHKRTQDAGELLELLEEEENASEDLEELKKDIDVLTKDLERIEFKLMLGGEHDARNAILHINAGAGGTESQDWAQMLMRMYLRWAERRGFQTETIDLLASEEAGIKSATLSVNGPYAYGYLRSEIGVHRLVRMSPFDAAKRRHTSFASVFVFPEVDDDIDIDINEVDLKIDTYRSSGAGGQHVNVTDSAVRITHLPSGIAQGPPLRPGTSKKGRGTGGHSQRQEADCFRKPDSLLCPSSLPDGQRPSDEPRSRQRGCGSGRGPGRIHRRLSDGASGADLVDGSHNPEA